MADADEPTPARKPRTDALRNRAGLLDAGKAAFAEKGSDASLDEIARRAGVGIGTLYRHFPTREALIEAVYRHETEQLILAASRFSATLPPMDALRAWLLLFVDYLATKQGMSEALKSIVDRTSTIYAASGAQMMDAASMLVTRAVGELPPGLDPVDLLRALAGVANINSGPDWVRAAKRLVDILVAGLGTSPRD